MLVKEITPVLHRLQEAFLVYEDQYDGEWDRSWYRFGGDFSFYFSALTPNVERLALLLLGDRYEDYGEYTCTRTLGP